MPKKFRLTDYVNSFNFMVIRDEGSYYSIQMRGKLDSGDNKYRTMDGTIIDTETYWVRIEKREPETHY